jgi:hypothetical protein
LALLLLLLLELLLELLGDRRHWRRAGGHGLLRRLGEAGELRLQLSRTLRRLQARVARVLLLERRLREASWLRGKRTRLRLLLLLLLLGQTSACAKGAAILRHAGALAVAAEKRVRVRVHSAGDGVVELGRAGCWGTLETWKRGKGGAAPTKR